MVLPSRAAPQFQTILRGLKQSVYRGRSFPIAYIVLSWETKRTTIRLTDERQRLLEQAKGIVASDQYDELPNSVVIDAALTHLIESQENIEDAIEGIGANNNTGVQHLRAWSTIEHRSKAAGGN